MSDYMPKCATCEHFESCIMQKHNTEIGKIIDSAPSIEIPPMPKGDIFGYKWKLKWVLEPYPTITKVWIQGADNESG